MQRSVMKNKQRSTTSIHHSCCYCFTTHYSKTLVTRVQLTHYFSYCAATSYFLMIPNWHTVVSNPWYIDRHPIICTYQTQVCLKGCGPWIFESINQYCLIEESSWQDQNLIYKIKLHNGLDIITSQGNKHLDLWSLSHWHCIQFSIIICFYLNAVSQTSAHPQAGEENCGPSMKIVFIAPLRWQMRSQNTTEVSYNCTEREHPLQGIAFKYKELTTHGMWYQHPEIIASSTLQLRLG